MIDSLPIEMCTLFRRVFSIGKKRLSERLMYRWFDCKAVIFEPSRSLPCSSDLRSQPRSKFSASNLVDQTVRQNLITTVQRIASDDSILGVGDEVMSYILKLQNSSRNKYLLHCFSQASSIVDRFRVHFSERFSYQCLLLVAGLIYSADSLSIEQDSSIQEYVSCYGFILVTHSCGLPFGI